MSSACVQQLRLLWRFTVGALLMFHTVKGQTGGGVFGGGGSGGIGGLGGTSSVKITLDGLQRSPAVSRVIWDANSRQNDVYCSGTPDLQDLRFFCATCNVTDGVNELIGQNVRRQTDVAGYPLIRLSDMPVTAALNGQTLQCDGKSDADSQQSFAQASATIDVRYINKPVVTDTQGRRAVYVQPFGYTIYVPCNRQMGANNQPAAQCSGTSSVTLNCEVRANPTPDILWTSAGGVPLGRGRTLTVDGASITSTQAVQCMAAFKDNSGEAVSDSVRLDYYDRPLLFADNFDQLRTSSVFSNGNQVRVGERFDLTCQSYANPMPETFWRMTRDGSRDQSRIYNITCPQGALSTVRSAPPSLTNNNPYYGVESKCGVIVANYSYQGQYWCAPCVQIANGAYDCGNPNRNSTIPTEKMISVDVVGPAVKLREYISPIDGEAVLTIDYCVDPVPNAEGLYWSIDGTTLRMGESWDNFEARPIEKLPDWTDCYSAKLLMSSVSEADKDRRYELVVSNTFETVRLAANVRSLEAGGAPYYYTAGSDAWWIVLIVLAAILLLVCCVGVFCCYVRKTLCFRNGPPTNKRQPLKNEPTQAAPSKDHITLLPGPNDKYISNVAPSQLSNEPRAYNYNPQPGAVTAADQGMRAVTPQRHEGYNYAELDLAPDSRYPPQAQQQQPPQPATDYSQLRPVTSMTVTSVNSVV